MKLLKSMLALVFAVSVLGLAGIPASAQDAAKEKKPAATKVIKAKAGAKKAAKPAAKKAAKVVAKKATKKAATKTEGKDAPK